MGILINKSTQILPRTLIGLMVIFLIGLSPILASIIGANLTELITGEPCHEGNCFWGAIGWLFFMTFPIAGLLLIVFIIVIIIDIVKLRN